jgi:hypothetical protein
MRRFVSTLLLAIAIVIAAPAIGNPSLMDEPPPPCLPCGQ